MITLCLNFTNRGFLRKVYLSYCMKYSSKIGKSDSFSLCSAACLFSLFFNPELKSTVLCHFTAFFHVSLTLSLFCVRRRRTLCIHVVSSRGIDHVPQVSIAMPVDFRVWTPSWTGTLSLDSIWTGTRSLDSMCHIASIPFD